MILRAFLYLLGGLCALLVIAPVAAWFWIASDLPDPRAVLDPETAPCPAPPAFVDANIPPAIRAALIAAEDPAFPKKRGLPSLNLLFGWDAHNLPLPALAARLQLAKTAQRTMRSQLNWLVQTDRMALHLSKDEIEEAVLQHSSFGRGAYGFSCAAQVYFGKSPSALSLSETVALAGLLKAPSFYDPGLHPNEALSRRNTIIDGMQSAGAISDADALAAKAELLIAK
ncbi:transglycosylase domain-containing protein [Aestuariivirga sp.]|uniref:transglycosylase domain-containing protein n=1 Tax=Aestuariivirga sp. TaxID=2650926 RepID=UPI0039E5A6FC